VSVTTEQRKNCISILDFVITKSYDLPLKNAITVFVNCQSMQNKICNKEV